MKKIAVIGGTGAMGKWFCKFFANQGIDVVATGKSREKLEALKKELRVEVTDNNAEAVKKADTIIVSVLMKDFEGVIKEIAPFIKGNQFVLDFTSVKEEPVNIMHKYIKNATVLGTHPLFGPGATDTNQNFVLTPTNPKEEKFSDDFGSWLKERGFNITKLSPRDHDEIMSIVLGLSHFIGLVTGETWTDYKISVLKRVAPPSFQRILGLVENIIDNNPEFYANLQMCLPKVAEVEEKFTKNARDILELVKKKDEKGFAERLKKLRTKMMSAK